MQRIVDRWREKLDVPGLSVSIRKAGSPVADVASGARNLAGDRLLPTDRLYAASITKVATAALALQLAEQGALSLDDRVSAWRPTFPNADRISLRLLLQHTAGVADYFQTPEFQRRMQNRPFDPIDDAELVSIAGKAKPTFQPGAGWSYSNTGYLLVGEAIERATAAKFVDAATTRLFGAIKAANHPIMMTQRGPWPADAAALDRVDGRWYDISSSWANGSILRAGNGADGALVTSAGDLARLGEQILWTGGSLLSAKSRSSMIEAATSDTNDYGLGVLRGQLALADGTTATTLGHGGSMPGYRSLLLHLPESEHTIAIMTNTRSFDGDALYDLASELVAATS